MQRLSIRSANGVLQISFEIRLIACAIHLIFKMFGYSSVIIRQAAWTLAPASVTIAENFFGPIFSKTCFISSAKSSWVCLSPDKFWRFYKYWWQSVICITKFQTDSLEGLLHPSQAKRKKYYNLNK